MKQKATWEEEAHEIAVDYAQNEGLVSMLEDEIGDLVRNRLQQERKRIMTKLIWKANADHKPEIMDWLEEQLLEE